MTLFTQVNKQLKRHKFSNDHECNPKNDQTACYDQVLSYLLKTVFFFSLALILLASSIIKDNFMASHCGETAIQKWNTWCQMLLYFSLI